MSDLSSHRIAGIEVSELTSRYPRTVGKNSHLGVHGDGPVTPIATIRTDQGAVGWGIIRGTPDTYQDLIGRELTDLFDPEVGVINQQAEPLDFALHDLAGVVLGQPVYQMLGAAGDTVVPCYCGAIYLDDLDPEDAPRGIDVVLENCANDYRLGYRAFKLKIGRGYKWMDQAEGLKRDIDVTRAVHEHYPECSILVDANNGYTGSGFLEYLGGVRDCDLFWVEEPFQESRDDLVALRHYLNEHSPHTLIADGELRPDIPFLLELAADNLLDVLLMDTVSFGLTQWRRLMPQLRDIGVRASPHAWGVPLKTLYTAQLAAGLGNVVTVEGVPGSAVGMDTSGYRLDEGKLHLPSSPGFGIDVPAAGQGVQK